MRSSSSFESQKLPQTYGVEPENQKKKKKKKDNASTSAPHMEAQDESAVSDALVDGEKEASASPLSAAEWTKQNKGSDSALELILV